MVPPHVPVQILPPGIAVLALSAMVPRSVLACYTPANSRCYHLHLWLAAFIALVGRAWPWRSPGPAGHVWWRRRLIGGFDRGFPCKLERRKEADQSWFQELRLQGTYSHASSAHFGLPYTPLLHKKLAACPRWPSPPNVKFDQI